MIKTRARLPEQAESFAAFIRDLGGTVRMHPKVNILIVSIESDVLERLRAHPFVELVGGVNFNRRVVLKRRKRMAGE